MALEKMLAVFLDQEKPWHMELFGKPTFRPNDTSGTAIEVTFEHPWVIRQEGARVILRAADGTEFKLGKGSDPKKEAKWLPLVDSALAPSSVTWSRQDHESEGPQRKQRRWPGCAKSTSAPMSVEGSAAEHALATFSTRNDAARTSFGSYLEPGSSSGLATQGAVTGSCLDEPYSVAALSKLRCLEAPPPPTQDHEDRLWQCIQSGRHSKAFNKWMTPADRSSYTVCGSCNDDELWNFHQKLQALNCPIGDEATAATSRLPKRKQVFRFEEKCKDICRTGGLLIGHSTGFSKASSFLHFGCDCCNAPLHISTPHLSSGGQLDPDLVGAIDRHLRNFLYERELEPPSLCMCTAERACPGAKHGDA